MKPGNYIFTYVDNLDREKYLQDISKALKPKRGVKQNKPQADF